MDIFKEALAITPCKVQLNGKTCIVAGTSGNVIPAQVAENTVKPSRCTVEL